jgi:tight adherence protein C
MMTFYPFFLCLLWTAAAAGLGWYCAAIAQQITYVTLADGRQQERRLPLIFRLLLPLAPTFMPMFRKPSLTKTRELITRRITAAGFEGLLSSEEFLSLRLLMPLILGPLWTFSILAAISATHSRLLHNLELSLVLLGVALFYFYPTLWLRDATHIRHRSIQRALPFVLDLLTLSVEAGMDFMTALQRNVERSKLDALSEELIRVIREIQIGKTRREALRDMSRRVNLPELKSVVSALVQADELGVSIGTILRIQSDQIRQRRFERAEKLANEAPVKMLGPLILFIFPSVFLILLGPIIARLAQTGL